MISPGKSFASGIAHVPRQAVQPGFDRRLRLRRTEAVFAPSRRCRRGGRRRARRRRRAGERPDQLALRVEELDGDLVGRLLQVVVDGHAARDGSHRVGRLEEHERSLVVLLRDLPQHVDVVHHVERAAVRRDHQVVVLDGDAVHRRDRQVQLKRLPRAAVVERDVDAGLGAEEQQALPLRVFVDRAREVVRADAVDDLRPGLP